MADTTTTNYGLTKPEVGASEDTWGTKINTNLDTLDTTVDSIQGKSGAGVLKHTNNTKLATTSTGIDVTGTVTVDSLGSIGVVSTDRLYMATSDGLGIQLDKDNNRIVPVGADGSTYNNNVSLGSSGLEFKNLVLSGTATMGAAAITGNITQGNGDLLYAGGGNWDIAHTIASQNLVLKTTPSGGSATQRIRISHNGDVSFYEDTGTTPKLFWDASAESLGIGTSSPSERLHIFRAAGTGAYLRLQDASGSNYIGTDGGVLQFLDGSAVERMRISSAGNLIMASGGSIVAGGANDLILNAGESGTPDIYLQSGGSTKVKIEGSNGNVGINETAPFGKLHISDTQTGRTAADSVGNLLVLEDDENGMSILSSDAGAGYILFGDAASAASGGIVYDHSANKFNFRTNDAWNRMVLDASGNLLVGKTSTDNTTAGTRIHPLGYASFTIANDYPIIANRLSSDGAIAVFRKDGTDVGSIGVHSSSLQIGTGNTQIKFSDAEDSFYVVNAAGVARDNSHDLGKTGARFKNLYLSGGVYANNASGAFLWNAENAHIAFGTNNTERARLDSAGRLGLGVTPEAWSSVFKVLRVGTGSSIAGESGGTSTWFNTNAYYDGSWKRINTNTSAQIAHTSDGKHEFKVAASGSAGSAISWNTAMTVDNSGNLLVGTPSFSNPPSGFTVAAGGETKIEINHVNGTGSGVAYATFRYNQSAVGSITQHGTSATLYNTTSDERAKENIADADDAGSKIDAIQVRKFDWKADGSHQDYGMIAQELQAVAPEAVSVPEDSEDMMGVDYSKLVPMLIKEIQSLRNRVAQLEE